MKSFYERVKATIQTSSPVEDSKVRKIKWSSSDQNLLSNILTIRKMLRKWLWNAADVSVSVVFIVITRGSKFWSSKVCEGGESREAYPVRFNEGGSNWVTWSFISKRNSGGLKVSGHAYASRDSPPSHTLLDQKLDPA